MELDYKQIGKHIAQRRRKLGLKQSEVEERADIGYKYLSNIERGVSIPSLEVILRLAVALETTPDTLLFGVAKPSYCKQDELILLLRSLDEDQIVLVESFLRWISEQK